MFYPDNQNGVPLVICAEVTNNIVQPTMKSLLKFAVLMTALLFITPLQAQVTIDQTMTPTELVQEVLLGEGITAMNVTFNGQPGNILNSQIGRYNGPSAYVDFDDGIAMASGPIGQIAGVPSDPITNLPGDSDLYTLANFGGTSFSVNNCAILEFDFIPTGDSLQIRFVFMSHEYPSFTCSSYNDPFGFFISGPGIDGGGLFSNNAQNIALIPNSDTFIGVNTINSGIPANSANCLNANPNYMEDSQFFVSNNPTWPDVMDPDDIQFPGMTVTITAFAAVTCGETYHIKLAIADASDTALDSGVIIEAASFQSNLYIDASLEIPVGVNDSTLYDGCGQAFLTFERPGDTTLVEVVYLEYSGDAINGVHYTELPDSIVFEENQSSVTFPLTVPPGADVTGMMQAIITITNIASQCSGDVLTSEFNFWVGTVDPLEAEFEDVAVDDCGEEITIGPIPSNGYGVYTFEWDNGSTDPEITVAPEVTTTYTVTVGDTCGMEPVTGQITVNVPTYPDVEVDAGDDITINTCLELAELEGEISGGNGVYSFEWYNGNELIGDTQSLDYSPLGGTSTIYFVGTDACGSTHTDSLTISVPPVDISVDAGPPLVLEHCFDSVMVEATVEGGIPGGYTYDWWAATTGGLASGPENSIWFNTPIESYIVVEVTDICGNQAVDSTLVTVTELEIIVDASPDQTVNSCHTFVDLAGSATGGYGDYTTVWTKTGDQIVGDAFGLNINPYSTTTYTLTVSDECGNVSQDEVTIVVDIPELTLEMSPDTLVCNGGIALLFANPDGGVPPYDFTWSSSSINGPEVSVQTYDTQAYTVQVYDACDGYITGSTTVVVSQVNAVFDIFYGNFYTIELNNRSTPGYYFWEFGDGNTSTQTDPVHSYDDVLEYTVTLEVTDSLGCQDTFTVVAVPEGEIYIPSSFTPNEDGINDLFNIQGFNIVSFDLVIINRYGQEVFKSNSMEVKWDGAEPAYTHYSQNEVYVYSIKAETTNGKLIEKQGTVTVVR